MNRIFGWIDRFARIGIRDFPKAERSGRYAFNVANLMGVIATPPFMLSYVIFGAPELALLVAPLLLLIFVPFLMRINTTLTVFGLGAFLICLFSVATYVTGAGSGLYLFIFAAVPATIFLQGWNRPVQTAILVGLLIAAMILCVVFLQEPSGHLQVGPNFNLYIFIFTLISLFLMVSAVIYALTHQVTKAEAALAAEHARSEALLHNLLPDEIAARLKDRPGEVIADGLPAVTLLFADIVDFTPRSARMPPEKLIGWLNRIFSAFDVLTAERGLEKIKTIGDAYMVAAGLPVARKDHAEIIADMALAMQAEVVQLSQELGEPIHLRIGIHSGPAIAGVIGTSKVFYDVWGDTVNTASRMESHGEPGRIQVTVATRVLLQDSFEFAPRGPVKIKGIGEIETYWLTGRR